MMDTNHSAWFVQHTLIITSSHQFAESHDVKSWFQRRVVHFFLHENLISSVCRFLCVGKGLVRAAPCSHQFWEESRSAKVIIYPALCELYLEHDFLSFLMIDAT